VSLSTEPEKRARLAVTGVTLLSALFLLVWSVAVPVFESPDEHAHWKVSRYIHDHLRLPPISLSEPEATQPPLYYLLIAPVAISSDLPINRLTKDSRGLPIRCCSSGRLYPNRSSDFQRFAVLRIVRIFSVLFSTLTVWLICLTSLELSGQPAVAFLSGAVAAFLPEFAFRGGSISNDALTTTLCAACLYTTVYIFRRGFTYRRGIAASVFLALSFLTKINGFSVVVPLLVVLMTLEGKLKDRVLRLSIFGVSLALVLPWLIYNEIVYGGDLLAQQATRHALTNMVAPKSIGDPYFLTTFPTVIWESFLGVFGHMTISMQPWMYGALEVFFGLAAVGVLTGLIRRNISHIVVAALVGGIALNLILAITYNLDYSQPQGRLLFPCLPCVALLAALGIRNLRIPAFGLVGLGCGLAVLNATVLMAVVIPAYWSSENEATAIDLQVNPGGSMFPAGPLTLNRELSQTFIAGHNNLSGVEILVDTYGARLSQGTLEMTLTAEENGASKVVVWRTWPAAQLRDNQPVRLNFPEIPESAGRTYSLIVASRGLQEGQRLTTWLCPHDAYPAGRLFVGGKEQMTELFLRTYIRVEER
jgi:hypothetical protein